MRKIRGVLVEKLLKVCHFNEVRPQSQGSRGENDTLEQPSSPKALLDMVRASFSM